MQFNPTISDFIKNRLIKKNQKETRDSNESEEELLKKFLSDDSSKAKNCEQASHIGKFTHPDAKPNVLFQSKDPPLVL